MALLHELLEHTCYLIAPLTMPKGPSITYRISEPIKVALDKRMEVTRETPTEVMNLALMKLLKLC